MSEVLERALALRLVPAAASGCRRRVHLDHDPDAVLPARPPADFAGGLIRAEIAQHRQLMSAAVDLPGVVRARQLSAGASTATVDLLLPEGGGFVPVLVKGHRTLDPGAGAVLSPVGDPLSRTTVDTVKLRQRTDDVMALAHVYRLLQVLGMAAPGPALGGIIGRNNAVDAVIGWYSLDDETLAEYDARIADRIRVAEAARSREVPLAWPSRVSQCRRCPWDPRCSVEMTVARDVSLIAPGADAVGLRGVGVRTIDELANADDTQLAGVAVSWLTGAERGPELRDRARVWVSGSPFARRHPVVSVRRADIELDVDMECFLDDGAYLWGTWLSGTAAGVSAARNAGFDRGYQPFLTWSELPDSDEGAMFADFWSYLRELQLVATESGLTFAAYCYSRQAEERWLFSTPARYPDVPGMPSAAQVRAFTASEAWVDMYEMLGREFVAAGSKRLKAVAPVAGFRWRDAEPDGANSMMWYRAALGGAGVAGDPAMKTRLLEYNEDDVLATHALRVWMTERAAEQTPLVTQLTG